MKVSNVTLRAPFLNLPWPAKPSLRLIPTYPTSITGWFKAVCNDHSFARQLPTEVLSHLRKLRICHLEGLAVCVWFILYSPQSALHTGHLVEIKRCIRILYWMYSFFLLLNWLVKTYLLLFYQFLYYIMKIFPHREKLKENGCIRRKAVISVERRNPSSICTRKTLKSAYS